jgi:hypothetical protein
MADSFSYKQPVLLWITEWGIWPSSENWQIYYRLRQSYGDHRELHDAPGHLFLNFEKDDLASFLQIAMLNGWGGYVLFEADYLNAFFSHDEYIDFFPVNEGQMSLVREWFGQDSTQDSAEAIGG